MAKPVKFDGTLGSPVGKTPFGYFDGDPVFIKEAPKVGEYIARRLGWPTMDIEISEKDLYAAFEEAILEFSSLVNEMNIQDDLILLQGEERTGEFENVTGKHVRGTPVHEAVKLAKNYGTVIGHGGNVTWKKDFINVKEGQQKYDLKQLLKDKSQSDSITEDRSIVIKKVHYYGPLAISRLYGSFSVGGIGSFGIFNDFGLTYGHGDWGAYENIMQPAYHDILRAQAVELNDYVYRSEWTYRLNNGVITLIPIPEDDFPLWFEWVYEDELDDAQVVSADERVIVSDYSNAPYDVHKYEDINDPSKRWIFKYALEVAKHKLGTVRSKYSSVPSPQDNFQLDGENLKQEAKQNMENLVQNLRERLEKLTRSETLKRQSEEQENIQDILNKIPNYIYTG